MDPVPADSQEAIEDLPSPLASSGHRPKLIDGAEVVRRMGEHSGIKLRFLEHCAGAGSGSGACRVADESGHGFFLSSIQGDEANRAQHARSMTVLERLWSMGHPAPHYEQDPIRSNPPRAGVRTAALVPAVRNHATST